MTAFHRTVSIAAAVVLLGAVTAPGVLARAASAPGAPAIPSAAGPTNTVDALYVENASRGTFNGRTLTLHGVAPQVSWFADRPARASGLMLMSQATHELFGDDQARPNAALDLADDDELAGVSAVQLSAPRYDAHTHVLTYRIKRLPSLTGTKLAYLEAQRTRARIPARFHAAALFIDDGQAPVPDPTSVPVSAGPSASGTLGQGAWPGQYIDTDAHFQQYVIDASSQAPVVVEFGAAWCGIACDRMNTALLAETGPRAPTMAFAYLDIDGGAANEAAQYNLTNLPTLMAFVDGKLVATLVGFMSQNALDQWLDGVASA